MAVTNENAKHNILSYIIPEVTLVAENDSAGRQPIF